MKKIIPELLFGILALFGFSLIYRDIPGGAEIVTLAMVLLTICYFPFGFIYLNEIPLGKLFLRNTYREISWPRRIGVPLSGMILSTFTYGTLFKIRMLPGAGELLSVGIVFGSIIVLVLIQRVIKSSNKSFYRRMLIRVSIFLLIGISAYFSY